MSLESPLEAVALCAQNSNLILIMACRLFSELVLPALLPGAVVLSGDLVDGKDEQGRGQQQLEEWQVRSS